VNRISRYPAKRVCRSRTITVARTRSTKLSTKLWEPAPTFAAYHSWEKELVESVNGLAPRYIPKGADIGKLTEEKIKWMEEQLNNRPRKCLGYRTPTEVFGKLCGALAG